MSTTFYIDSISAPGIQAARIQEPTHDNLSEYVNRYRNDPSGLYAILFNAQFIPGTNKRRYPYEYLQPVNTFFPSSPSVSVRTSLITHPFEIFTSIRLDDFKIYEFIQQIGYHLKAGGTSIGDWALRHFNTTWLQSLVHRFYRSSELKIHITHVISLTNVKPKGNQNAKFYQDIRSVKSLNRHVHKGFSRSDFRRICGRYG